MKSIAFSLLCVCAAVMSVEAQSTVKKAARAVPIKAQIQALPAEERSPVLMAGDSMMRLLSQAMERQLAQIDGVEASSLTSLGSGLARSDAFDWVTRLSEVMAEKKPQVVVITLGANDYQVLQDAAGRKINTDSPEWTAEYASRVGKVMDVVVNGGAKHLIWLQLPDMKDPTHQKNALRINAIASAEAAKRPGKVELFEMGPVVARKPGRFVSYVMNPDGTVLTVREPDGIHLSADGAAHVAAALIKAYWTPAK